jgi:hypothetical protein
MDVDDNDITTALQLLLAIHEEEKKIEDAGVQAPRLNSHSHFTRRKHKPLAPPPASAQPPKARTKVSIQQNPSTFRLNSSLELGKMTITAMKVDYSWFNHDRQTLHFDATGRQDEDQLNVISKNKDDESVKIVASVLQEIGWFNFILNHLAHVFRFTIISFLQKPSIGRFDVIVRCNVVRNFTSLEWMGLDEKTKLALDFFAKSLGMGSTNALLKNIKKAIHSVRLQHIASPKADQSSYGLIH